MIKKIFRILKCDMRMEIERVFLFKMACLLEYFADFIPIVVMQFVWSAGYSGSFVDSGFGLNEMYVYTLITLGLTSIYGNSIIEKLSPKVIKGDVIFDLIKPINNYIMYILDDFARVFKFLVIRFIPIFVTSLIIFNISFDFININRFFPFLLMMMLGYVIMFDIAYTASLLSAWIINIYTCRFMINQIFKVFSGAIIPLWMWGSLENILNITPFPYIIAAPVSFLLGESNEYDLNILMIQIIWILILKFIMCIMYKRYRKRLNIQGG